MIYHTKTCISNLHTTRTGSAAQIRPPLTTSRPKISTSPLSAVRRLSSTHLAPEIGSSSCMYEMLSALAVWRWPWARLVALALSPPSVRGIRPTAEASFVVGDKYAETVRVWRDEIRAAGGAGGVGRLDAAVEAMKGAVEIEGGEALEKLPIVIVGLEGVELVSAGDPGAQLGTSELRLKVLFFLACPKPFVPVPCDQGACCVTGLESSPAGLIGLPFPLLLRRLAWLPPQAPRRSLRRALSDMSSSPNSLIIPAS
jgi:hypothetical protein